MSAYLAQVGVVELGICRDLPSRYDQPCDQSLVTSGPGVVSRREGVWEIRSRLSNGRNRPYLAITIYNPIVNFSSQLQKNNRGGFHLLDLSIAHQ